MSAFTDDKMVIEIRARKVYGEKASTVIWVAPFEGERT